MLSALFHALVYDPLYNGVVFFASVVPSHDIGLAVIALTVVVRIILFPLSNKAIASQMAMKRIQPEVEELRKKFRKNSPEQSQAILALYRKRGVNPFAGLFVMLIQLPILIGLYFVFLSGGFPAVDASLLYSFITPPPEINMHFLGLVDMGAKHNIVLALLTGLTQLVYTRLSMGPRGSLSATEATLSGDIARSFDLQARYGIPIIIGFIAYTIPAAAPLYWVTSNLFMIGQEFASGRRFGNSVPREARA